MRHCELAAAGVDWPPAPRTGGIAITVEATPGVGLCGIRQLHGSFGRSFEVADHSVTREGDAVTIPGDGTNS